FSGITGTGRELWTYAPGETFDLSIHIDGTEVAIPANVGVRGDGSTASTYSLGNDGQIYFEPGSGVTLAEFFDNWRTDAGLAGNNPDAFLTPTQVLDSHTDLDSTLQVFVDGAVIKDFADYVIQGDEEITIVYGSNPVV